MGNVMNINTQAAAGNYDLQQHVASINRGDYINGQGRREKYGRTNDVTIGYHERKR